MDGIQATTPQSPVVAPAGPARPAPEAAPQQTQAPGDKTQTSAPRKGIEPAAIEFDEPAKKPRPEFHRQGTMYGYWGWNRSAYTKSDIHLTGHGYDITLNNAQATDKPGFSGTAEFFKVIATTQPTIPQYNYRFGYYTSDKTSFSVGQDHWKYKLAPQMADVTGTISPEASAQFAGTYNHTPLAVGSEGNAIADYQHCDGLNVIDVMVGHTENLWVSPNGKHALSLTGAVGPGIVITDTHADIFGNDHDNHYFRMDGVAADASLGLRADVFRYGFIEAQVKGSYVNLYDVKTVGQDGKATQQFGVLGRAIVAGINVPIQGKKKHAGPVNP